MDKRFLGILAALVIIFGAVFALTQHSSNKAPSSTAQPSNHVEGLGQKGVTLIEYGDYECPICELYYQPVKQVQAQFNNQIFFQFRNLPLSQVHPNAFAGARAAEAASLQGKFWQMHDALYDNQTAWVSLANPQSAFDAYGKKLGLNISQFDSDYASSKVNDTINADLDAFSKTGQQMSTPTFFLDGTYVDYSKITDSNNQPSVSKFVALINAEIAKKNPASSSSSNNQY